MKTLRHLLFDVPEGQHILVGRQGALCREELTFVSSSTEAKGRSVAICSDDIAQALKWLVALDGAAANVLLLSHSLDAGMALSLAEEAGCDLILTPRDDLLARAEEITIASSLNALKANAPINPAAASATTWTLTTSGTTGRPKLIEHTLESLTRTTKIDHARGAGQVWAMLYDYTRFAGLQVLLQAVLSGAKLIAPPIDEQLQDRVAFFLDCQCTHLSCTPTLWRKLLMVPDLAALPLRQATLGGEIADNRVLAAIHRHFPEARVTHIYASTEAGVGFSVSDRQAGFPVSFLDTRQAGVGLRLSDDNILEIQTDPAGEWINTQDRVQLKDDRVLFLGRDNGTINVGGDKIHPEEVEGAVLEHDEVMAVRVFGRENAFVGAIVCAQVQVSPGLMEAGGVASKLRRFLANRLPRHKIPAVFEVVDAIEVTSGGKIERKVF